MHRLLTLFALFLLLCACSNRERYTAMRHGLDSINQRNRNDQPFSPADVEPYVSYFADHGNSNDRMLAYYLLGRAYHEQGEAPMALQHYQEAITVADTASKDCDFAQLSRVYGQTCELFYYQGLYQDELRYRESAIRYAWLGKDTLSALLNYEHKAFTYKKLQNSDSVITICENASLLYKKFGYHEYAASVLGSCLREVIEKGEYIQAKQYMDVYENESGFFNQYHQIESGREIYYNIKGLFYLNTGKVDSAEYFFRKELYYGKDCNNQNAGAYGLAMVYEKRQRPDSAAKYYRYAYTMNDSMYAQQATTTVERMQAMYDYTRHQDIARHESERATKEKTRWQMLLMILFSVFFIAFLFINNIHRKRKEEQRLYQETLEELDQAQTDILQLRLHESDYEKALAEKEKKIDTLKKKMRKYSKLMYFGSDIIEKHLTSSPNYIKIEKKILRGEVITDEDWQTIRILVIEYLPGFNDFLLSNTYQLNETKYNICILLRLHFKSVDISKILGIRPASVSEACSSIMKKIFDEEGSAKELSLKLNEIF